MKAGEIRTKYLEFFKNRGHKIIPSASLVPEGDATTLFTGSGMQPLLPYLLGKNHPAGDRLVDSQKCIRSMDIEEVGDNRHTTFFEMLGNWSFGDYFKKEQLSWFYEFLTKEIGISQEKLWVTCFEGDPKLELPKDMESAQIWEQLGIPRERIQFYGSKKNWWSRAGTPEEMPAGEPGGPDSEVFYDFGTPHDKRFGKECHPNCDCGRFLEIGNSVFMQYIKKEDGSFALLPKQNVDFGGGLERITAAKEDNPDIFSIDVFQEALRTLEMSTGKKYQDNKREFRIILDHIRASVFLLADGVIPSNTERGYVLRRLLRRAIRFADHLEMKERVVDSRPDYKIERGVLSTVAEGIAKEYASPYPEGFDLTRHYNQILPEIEKEERKFRETLQRGMREFTRFTKQGTLNAQDAFQLFTTYGFPIELIIEEAQIKGVKDVDIEGVKELFKKHQELSRAGSEHKFKGGLADHAEKTIKLHTAHHLLLKALQIVLGPEVKQRGSNITQERLRIDFNWGDKTTEEQKKEVERIVNEKISEDLPVIHSEMDKEEAEKLGAQHEFGAKYPDRVSVYSVGPKGATVADPQFNKAFSIEFCGGPHVASTGEIGKLHIIKEEAVSAGIRRIRADVS